MPATTAADDGKHDA